MKLITRKEFAAMLGVSVQYIRRHFEKLRFRMPGRMVRYDAAKVENYIRNMSQ